MSVDPTITVTERVTSREMSGGSITMHFSIAGTASEADAMTALLANTDSQYSSRVREQYPSIEPVWVDTEADGGAGDGLWEATVRYEPVSGSGASAVPEVGDSSYQFDTTGGSQHVTHSLKTISATPPTGGTAPVFGPVGSDGGGGIGYNGDGFDGVDIVAPTYAFSETHYIANTAVTSAYRQYLFGLTGTVNNATFKGFAAGEVLFLGATGAARGNGDSWEITFRFAASKNATNITVGDITVPAKKGWEYLWVHYEQQEDSTAKRRVAKPIAAYVEKVYEEGDFSNLGIGTT